MTLRQRIAIASILFAVASSPSVSFAADKERLKAEIATYPKSKDAWLALGLELYTEGEYGQAEWVLRRARELAPNDPYTLWLSGIVAYVMRDFSTARAILDKVAGIEYPPSNVRMDVVYDLLGRMALDRDDLFTASFYFFKAAELVPDNWQYQYFLGFSESYRGPGRLYKAFQALHKARSLNQKNIEVLERYAWAFAAFKLDSREPVQSNPYNEATRLVTAAISADRGNYENHELLGLILFMQHRDTEACNALRTAVSLAPTQVGPRLNLAKALLRIGTESARKEAEDELVVAIAANPIYTDQTGRAPHTALLEGILIRAGRLGEAASLMAWENQHAR
jgi:Flp pilus assembly protein TadD